MSAPKVLGLAGYGLSVPDLEIGRQFYERFGLTGAASDQAVALRSAGRDEDEVILVPGREKRLDHVAFHIRPEDVARFADHLRRLGLDVRESAPGAAIRDGLWFQDPWGTWINLVPRLPQAIAAIDLHPLNLGGRSDRVDVNLWQELPKDRGPLRIGHLLLFTADWEKAEAFYEQALGLRTTDRAQGKVSFMAAGEGVIDHHCFGLINASHRGFQHASFQVASFDDIGYGAWRMRKAGYKDGFGPGRHAIASNLFHYVRDPWGSWVEYYADMDKISPAWVTRDWQDLPYTWGPEWSPEFWGGEMNANLEPR